MTPDSPYWHFDPTSVGSLHRKMRDGIPVYKEDIVALMRADPECASDRVMQQYLLPALEGKLSRPKGRQIDESRPAKITVAAVLVSNWAKEIRDERRGKPRDRTRQEPCVQAAQEVSRYLGLGVTGRGLLNAISSQKKI
jgi:hypothetical protein